jgi:hypothetical protein
VQFALAHLVYFGEFGRIVHASGPGVSNSGADNYCNLDRLKARRRCVTLGSNVIKKTVVAAGDALFDLRVFRSQCK